MSIDPARWLRLSQLFDQAIELADAQRAAFVESACGDDPELRAELQKLLDADATASDFDAGARELISTSAAGTGTDAEPERGTRLGAWRLQDLLGSGGSGTVHAARREDDDTGQRAAIKRLQRRWDGSLQAQRFLQERRILAQLSHPNIPALLDHGLDDDGRPWFALEFVDGDTLVAWADAKRLSPRERIVLFGQVCAAVQHAHERFIVHRDLKPANILVDGEGRVRVLDFGVAKRLDLEEGATRTGLFAGFTPEYAAPEQITGGAITAATDVYALGVVLYQLLSGRLPYAFAHDDLHGAADAVTSRTAERLDRALTTGEAADVQERIEHRNTSPTAFRRFVRGDLTRIVQTALAKEPDRRYPSVQALAADLRRFLDGRPVSVSGDTFGYRTRKFVQRNRWGVAMASLAVLALGAGITGIVLKSHEAQAAAARAEAEAARAERQAERARSDARTLESTNEFLRSVFESGDPLNGGNPDIRLREAMDNGVERIRSAAEVGPQAKLRFLLAAASSYSGMGLDERAQAMGLQAQAIQQQELPDSAEDKARVLSTLSWLRMTYEPEKALEMGREALALERSLDPPSLIGMLNAYSAVMNAQVFNGDQSGSIDTIREVRAFLRASGSKEYGTDMATLASNEGLALSALKRYDESYVAHRDAIALRVADLGADALGVALERMFYAFSLLRGGRHAEALQQLDQAAGPIQAALPAQSDSPMQLRYARGMALSPLGRHAEAIAELQAAHAYGRDHPFHLRQASVGWYLAATQARAGDCAGAKATLAELAQRKIALPADKPPPLQGTACTP